MGRVRRSLTGRLNIESIEQIGTMEDPLLADIADIGAVRWRTPLNDIPYNAYARALSLKIAPYIRRTRAFRLKIVAPFIIILEIVLVAAIVYWDVSALLN